MEEKELRPFILFFTHIGVWDSAGSVGSGTSHTGTLPPCRSWHVRNCTHSAAHPHPFLPVISSTSSAPDYFRSVHLLLFQCTPNPPLCYTLKITPLEELKCIILWFKLLPFKPLGFFFKSQLKPSDYSASLIRWFKVLREPVQIQRVRVQYIIIT